MRIRWCKFHGYPAVSRETAQPVGCFKLQYTWVMSKSDRIMHIIESKDPEAKCTVFRSQILSPATLEIVVRGENVGPA